MRRSFRKDCNCRHKHELPASVSSRHRSTRTETARLINSGWAVLIEQCLKTADPDHDSTLDVTKSVNDRDDTCEQAKSSFLLLRMPPLSVRLAEYQRKVGVSPGGSIQMSMPQARRPLSIVRAAASQLFSDAAALPGLSAIRRCQAAASAIAHFRDCQKQGNLG